MNQSTTFRGLSTALVVALAAAFAAPGFAQNANPSGPGPGNSSTNNAGEAYPNNPTAADKNKPKANVIQRAENSRPVKATKRVTKRATNAVKRAGNRTKAAVRNTGDKINESIPPGPNDAKK